MNRIIAVVTLCTIAVNAQVVQEDEEIDFFKYYIHGMKGFWSGYMEGLYNSKQPGKLTPECLSEDIALKTEFLSQYFTDGADRQGNMFLVVESVFAIVANVEDCGFLESIDDIENFCLAHTEKCKTQALYASATSKTMQLIGHGTTLVQAFQDFPGETE